MAIVLLRVQQRELVAVVHGKQIAMLLRELDRLVGQAHELRAVLVPLGLVHGCQLVRVVADRLELLGVELQLVHDGVERDGVRFASLRAELEGFELREEGGERGEHLSEQNDGGQGCCRREDPKTVAVGQHTKRGVYICRSQPVRGKPIP